MRIKADKDNILINSELILKLISNESLREIVHNDNLYEEVLQGLNNIIKNKDLLTLPIFFRSDAHPRTLIPQWRDCVHSFEGKTEKEKLAEIHSLLEKTKLFALCVMQHVKLDADGSDNEKTVKKESTDNIQEKLSFERRKLNDLMSEISTAQLSESKSNKRLNDLQQQLDKQRERVLGLQQELNDAKDEIVKEEEWNYKIKQSFQKLNEITKYYDNERRNIKWEWRGWIIIIILDIIAFSQWCWYFISLLINNEYNIEGIIDLTQV